MKKVFLLAALAFPFWAMSQNEEVKLKTFEDSVAYAIGCDIAESLKQMNINYEVLVQSISDYSKGKSKFSKDNVMMVLNDFQMRQQMSSNVEAEKNIETGKKFLAENRNSKSVHETPSGLQYKVLEQGKGNKPKPTDRIKFHYKGYDRGQPLSGEVSRFIAGWVEGIQLMPEGSKYIFYIPSQLGYGNQQAGKIPPGSLLIFEVELLEILK